MDKGPARNDNIQNFDTQTLYEKTSSSANKSCGQKSALCNSYWLTRIILIRYLGFIYFIAFFIAYNQNSALIGPNGLTPANKFMNRVNDVIDGNWYQKFTTIPTLFLFVEPTDENLEIISIFGMSLSLFIIFVGTSNVVIMFLLWISYMSIVNVGQTWYSFGWESQLLETGFIAIFICPLYRISKFSKYSATPYISVLAYRWLIFRIMLGAGLIKIRGDECWRNLTCMNYHYLTQPVPNPISPYLHNLPTSIHMMETMGNHVVELLLPWLILIPNRKCRLLGGAVQIVFQLILIISGNLSFLNWLTIVPAICCFDDWSLSSFFDSNSISNAYIAQCVYLKYCNTYCYFWTLGDGLSKSFDNVRVKYNFRTWFQVCIRVYGVNMLLLCITLYGSYPVVKNLISPNQAMNTSFGSFRLVNTYGAFGTVTKIRHEVILQGTSSDILSEDINNIKWKEYNFKCKPGDINRKPCVITPYHYRLDWLMWFSAFQNYQSCPWLIHLVWKLLNHDANIANLLDASGDPFSDLSCQDTVDRKICDNVKYIRAQLYEYRYSGEDAANYTASDDGSWEVGIWWTRKYVKNYIPPISVNDQSAQQFLKHYGWMEN